MIPEMIRMFKDAVTEVAKNDFELKLLRLLFFFLSFPARGPPAAVACTLSLSSSSSSSCRGKREEMNLALLSLIRTQTGVCRMMQTESAKSVGGEGEGTGREERRGEYGWGREKRRREEKKGIRDQCLYQLLCLESVSLPLPSSLCFSPCGSRPTVGRALAEEQRDDEEDAREGKRDEGAWDEAADP